MERLTASVVFRVYIESLLSDEVKKAGRLVALGCHVKDVSAVLVNDLVVGHHLLNQNLDKLKVPVV